MSPSDVAENQLQTQQLLWGQEAQYRGIFEAARDGLMIHDLDTGSIIEVNPALCAMYGYSRDELMGLPAKRLLHAEDPPLDSQQRQAVLGGEQFEMQALAVRRDGSSFQVELKGGPLPYQGKTHVLSIVRDISKRMYSYQMLEQRVQERTQELTALLHISHKLISTLDLSALLDLILDQLACLMDYAGASILTVHGDQLAILNYRGPIPREQALQLRFPLERSRANRRVIVERRPVIIGDVYADELLSQEFRAAAGDELGTTYSYIRSWMGVPLIAKDRIIGMLTLDCQQPYHYTQHHADLAEAIAGQAAVAIENARLYEQAQELAVLQERQRLARELHDSVSQALYGITLGARTAHTLLGRDPSRAAEPLEYVLSLAEAALSEMRTLIFELRPEALENQGLAAALNQQIASLRARHGLAVQVDLCPEPELAFERKVALYRIAQEALHNAVKHARAGRLEVTLSCAEHEVVLEIRDDGQGFDPQAAYPGHLGLQSMHERTARLGGRLYIASEPGTGTRVRAHIPGSR